MERRQQRLVERWMVCLATGKHPGILGTPEPRRSRLLARAEARRLFHPAASEIGSLDLYLAGDLQHRRSGGNGKRAFRRSSGVCDDELSRQQWIDKFAFRLQQGGIPNLDPQKLTAEMFVAEIHHPSPVQTQGRRRDATCFVLCAVFEADVSHNEPQVSCMDVEIGENEKVGCAFVCGTQLKDWELTPTDKSPLHAIFRQQLASNQPTSPEQLPHPTEADLNTPETPTEADLETPENPRQGRLVVPLDYIRDSMRPEGFAALCAAAAGIIGMSSTTKQARTKLFFEEALLKAATRSLTQCPLVQRKTAWTSNSAGHGIGSLSSSLGPRFCSGTRAWQRLPRRSRARRKIACSPSRRAKLPCSFGATSSTTSRLSAPCCSKETSRATSASRWRPSGHLRTAVSRMQRQPTSA